MKNIKVSYVNSYLFVELFDDNNKVRDLSVRCYQSRLCLGNVATAFININPLDDIQVVLACLNIQPTGRQLKLGNKQLVEYDFTEQLRAHNKALGRDKMLPGMIDVTDQVVMSTSVVYYIYFDRRKQIYHAITTDGWDFIMKNEFAEKAIKNYRIPVFDSLRMEVAHA